MGHENMVSSGEWLEEGGEGNHSLKKTKGEKSYDKSFKKAVEQAGQRLIDLEKDLEFIDTCFPDELNVGPSSELEKFYNDLNKSVDWIRDQKRVPIIIERLEREGLKLQAEGNQIGLMKNAERLAKLNWYLEKIKDKSIASVSVEEKSESHE